MERDPLEGYAIRARELRREYIAQLICKGIRRFSYIVRGFRKTAAYVLRWAARIVDPGAQQPHARESCIKERSMS